MTAKRATLLLVRPDPVTGANRRDDVRRAKTAAKRPPCWVILIGGRRDARREDLANSMGVRDIAKNGVNVLAPVEVSRDDDVFQTAELASALARYLLDQGLRRALERATGVDVRLPKDLEPALLAAVVEACTIYPDIDIWIGDQSLETNVRWEIRRDLFRSPPPRGTESLWIGMPHVEATVERYARLPYPVLILGETGSGKELVARGLHSASGRGGAFIPTNAAELPDNLAESLLFGHTKGAFTGASTERAGRIREAEGGTFFLDEVFDLSPAVQGKLLRALDRADRGEIVVQRLGATKPDTVRARLLVSAQRDPREGPVDGAGSSMRHDLYYRLAVGIIHVPPLRERLEDLPKLVEHLLEEAGTGRRIDQAAYEVLCGHDWPGNVRELRLILLRAHIDCAGTRPLRADDLREALDATALEPALALRLPCNLEEELARREVATMRAALELARGNQTKAGRQIGLGPTGAKNFKRRLANAEKRLRSGADDDER